MWVSKNRFVDDVLLFGYYDYVGDLDGCLVVYVFDLVNNINCIIDFGMELFMCIELMKGVGVLFVFLCWECCCLWCYDSYLNLCVIKFDLDDGVIMIVNCFEFDGV